MWVLANCTSEGFNIVQFQLQAGDSVPSAPPPPTPLLSPTPPHSSTQHTHTYTLQNRASPLNASLIMVSTVTAPRFVPAQKKPLALRVMSCKLACV